LYGSIIQKTFQRFLTDIQWSKSDVFIIGRVGKSLFVGSGIGLAYTYYEFSDTEINYQEAKKLVDQLVEYTTVVVYHGTFRTVMTQDAVASNISGDIPAAASEQKKKTRWIFEPTLGAVMDIFQTEIFSSFFLQTIHESMLAKYASRLTMLDEAQGNIKERIGKVILQKERAKHRVMNHKQLGTFSSIALWSK
jgi:F0F1-type ATP synthase gamma subunit